MELNTVMTAVLLAILTIALALAARWLATRQSDTRLEWARQLIYEAVYAAEQQLRESGGEQKLDYVLKNVAELAPWLDERLARIWLEAAVWSLKNAGGIPAGDAADDDEVSV